MQLSPKKLHHSKWTAVTPTDREKHGIVTRVIEPEDGSPIVMIALQAVHSQCIETMAWRDLLDASRWSVKWK